MRGYWFIIKNSLKATSRIVVDIIFAVSNPLIQMYGLVLFYSYVINKGASLSPSIILYFSFVAFSTMIDGNKFAKIIGEDIETEYYLTIDKLPINPILYYTFQSLGKYLAPLVVLSVGITWILVYYQASLGVILLFYVAVIVSLIITYMIYFLLGIMRFFTSAFEPFLFVILIDFLGGKLIPISFLPGELFRLFLSFMPFIYTAGAFAAYVSEGNVLGLLQGIGVGLVWVVILYLIGTKLWNRGVTEYQERGE